LALGILWLALFSSASLIAALGAVVAGVMEAAAVTLGLRLQRGGGGVGM
jgi:hypothetical protein